MVGEVSVYLSRNFDMHNCDLVINLEFLVSQKTCLFPCYVSWAWNLLPLATTVTGALLSTFNDQVDALLRLLYYILGTEKMSQPALCFSSVLLWIIEFRLPVHLGMCCVCVCGCCSLVLALDIALMPNVIWNWEYEVGKRLYWTL